MSKINDGGQAFPRSYLNGATALPGMSLRDWFAGQAMNLLLTNDYDWRDLARDAYAVADFMITERDTDAPPLDGPGEGAA